MEVWITRSLCCLRNSMPHKNSNTRYERIWDGRERTLRIKCPLGQLYVNNTVR